MLAVLDLAASKAGWGSPNPEGWFPGIAAGQFEQTCVAMIAQVSVSNEGEVRVRRAVCAIDCELVVNPLAVEAQIEGAVAYGVSAVLKGEITFTDGAADQSNFDDYPILRMNEMPRVEVHIVPSKADPWCRRNDGADRHARRRQHRPRRDRPTDPDTADPDD